MPESESTSAPHPALYLLDGHAQMFRSFFAIRGGMTSPVTGEPTNASFAFAGLLLKLLDSYQPDYVAMAIDSSSKSFRNDIYPDYKANRDETPEDFKAQVPRMLEIAELLGIPILKHPTVEADDILATLAVALPAQHEGLRIRLVAKDKDLEQVMSDRVTLFDAHTDTELDVEALLSKKGITPTIAIDYQALIGDTADNIPGVKGIGPKTAAKLLDRFGSLDQLIAQVDELKGKQRENLQHAVDSGQLALSKELVTLKTDVDTGFDLAASAWSADKADGPALLNIFRTLGFNRHQNDLRRLLHLSEDNASPTQPTKPSKRDRPPAGGLFDMGGDEDESQTAEPSSDTSAGHYTAITTPSELKQLVETLGQQDLVAVDCETIGLGQRAELCGVCLSWQEGQGVYIPLKSPEPESHLDWPTVRGALSPWLADADRHKCGHNIKYDLHVLEHAGAAVRGVVFDSMVAAFLTNRPGRGMDDLALSELGYRCTPIDSLIGPKPSRKSDPAQKTMDAVALDRVTRYAAEDADITLRLCRHLMPEIEAMGASDLSQGVEMPLIEILTAMERTGVRVDPDELDRQREGVEARAAALRRDVLDRAGVDFNPDSPKQLAELLFETLGFPKQKKTKTGYSTDSEVLDKLAEMHEAGELEGVAEAAQKIPSLVLEYRMLTKLVGTYLVALKDAIWRSADGGDDRVHATFHQTGAATGRLSSSNPNLQNIPIRTDVGREVRRAFVAEPGHVLVCADYSQIELRVLAHLSKDPALIQAFQDGQDIHRAVAAEVFGVEPNDVTAEQRGHAKTINFGIVYGVTAFGLARRIDGLDLAGAKALITNYKTRFAGIETFLHQCIAQAQDLGYVTTIMQRRRPIAEIDARNPQRRALAERLAINSVVQGSAADLIKKAMVELHPALRDMDAQARLLIQVHDELVVECREAEAETVTQTLTRVMTSAMSLDVPLEVEAGVGSDWYSAK